jgi:TRAP-type C4-dicarboxylate transport system substrate-binding protein
MSSRILAIIAGLFLTASPALADAPVVLRMATVGPEGSLWARELRATTLEVERRSKGGVRLKWYFSAVAGDEPQVAERIRRGLLDGTGGSNSVCEPLSPSMRVLSMPGLFRDREESIYVAKQLAPDFAAEMRSSGFTLLNTFNLGPAIVFARNPLHNLAELRAARLWEWDSNESSVKAERAMGLQPLPLPIMMASHAYDERRVDGFLALPGAALAFQWSAQARYLLDLRVRYNTGCIVIADRALEKLSPANRDLVRAIFADVEAHYEDVLRGQDELLLGGLFQRQGMKPIRVDAAFRAEFDAAAAKARQQMGESAIPRPLMDRVLGLVQAYRAGHAER